MVKVTKKINNSDITDKSLLVSSYGVYAQTTDYNKNLIIDALKREARVKDELAEEIASAVDKKIHKLEVESVSSTFIRALVDEELTQRGQTRTLLKQKLLGISTFDLEQSITNKTQENANVINNTPETVNLYISETILKQYALNRVFSSDVTDAHLNGVIHIHDLGFITRIYCGAHSIEQIKKFGLKDLLNLSTQSAPAKHAHTLTGHLNTFLCSMQAFWNGAMGLAYLNTFYAPLLAGLTYKEIKSEAQYLIFSLSQCAFSRGSQTLFLDANIDLEVPDFLKKIPCIVSAGCYGTEFQITEHKKVVVLHPDKRKATLKDLEKHLVENKEIELSKLINQAGVLQSKLLTFGDFEHEAQLFAKALLEVWYAGDKNGKIFAFPKCDLHVNEMTFKDPKQRELLMFACKMAAEKSITNFFFERNVANGIQLSQCCRLKETITDMSLVENPETLRFTGFQNVSINIPQTAYRAQGDFDRTVKEIKFAMDLAMKTHLEKKKYIATLMDTPGKPLYQIGKIWSDGNPYVDLEKCTYIIGIVGLNEAVQRITGKQLDEDDDAYKIGLKIITHMYLYCKELSKRHSLKVTLEESPAESTSPRFAKIDLKKYPESEVYIKGNKRTGDVYYTNSVHLPAASQNTLIERIAKQGKFCQLIESGSICHCLVGEQNLTQEAVFDLIEKTYKNTQTAQITISAELVFCEECGHVHHGFNFLD
jgi:ribonucleoside-triphosphate reductase